MKFKLVYAIWIPLIGILVTTAIIFLSKIFLILGIGLVLFLVGLLIDFINGKKKKKR